MRRSVSWGVALLALLLAGPAFAVDMSGRWFVQQTAGGFGPFPAQWSATQTGTDLTIGGAGYSWTGTIDPVTGAFTLTQTAGCDTRFYEVTGNVDAGSTSFTMTGMTDVFFPWNGCGGPYDYTATGARCGNGVLDPGEACDDGDETPGDCCSASCQPNPGGTCDDGNPCTTEACDAAGTCVATPVSAGTPCPDWNPCTADTCDDAGVCQHDPLPDGSACDDHDFCNGPDTCSVGLCTVHAGDPCVGLPGCFACSANRCTDLAPFCDDHNSCTADTCVPGVGCRHTTFPDGTACDDGAFCNGADRCRFGFCQIHGGNPCVNGADCETCNEATDRCDVTTCDDGNPCTNDSCSTGSCQHVPNSAPCDDGLWCDGADHCSLGACAAHTGNPCHSGIECQTCIEAEQRCQSSSCDDGNACTTDECFPGVCEHLPNDAACDDGDPCTTDSCAAAGCTSTPLPGCIRDASRARLSFTDLATGRDRLAWHWDGADAVVAAAEFGDPAGSDDLELCVSAGDDAPACVTIPHGGTCGGRPCWRVLGNGFKYRDAAGTHAGITAIVLKGGGSHATVTVSGKGPQLPLDGPGPWRLPLHVTLRSPLPRRWTATLGRARTNDASRLSASFP